MSNRQGQNTDERTDFAIAVANLSYPDSGFAKNTITLIVKILPLLGQEWTKKIILGGSKMLWYIFWGVIIGIIVGALGMALVVALAIIQEQKKQQKQQAKNIEQFFTGVLDGLKKAEKKDGE